MDDPQIPTARHLIQHFSTVEGGESPVLRQLLPKLSVLMAVAALSAACESDVAKTKRLQSDRSVASLGVWYYQRQVDSLDARLSMLVPQEQPTHKVISDSIYRLRDSINTLLITDRLKVAQADRALEKLLGK